MAFEQWGLLGCFRWSPPNIHLRAPTPLGPPPALPLPRRYCAVGSPPYCRRPGRAPVWWSACPVSQHSLVLGPCRELVSPTPPGGGGGWRPRSFRCFGTAVRFRPGFLFTGSRPDGFRESAPTGGVCLFTQLGCGGGGGRWFRAFPGSRAKSRTDFGFCIPWRGGALANVAFSGSGWVSVLTRLFFPVPGL